MLPNTGDLAKISRGTLKRTPPAFQSVKHLWRIVYACLPELTWTMMLSKYKSPSRGGIMVIDLGKLQEV
jgi:hypothetical protein